MRGKISKFIWAIVLFSTVSWPWAQISRSYSSEKASFAVRVKTFISSYRVMSVFVLPGETIELMVPEHEGVFSVQLSSGNIKTLSTTQWAIQAPNKPGIYPIEVIQKNTQEKMRINQVVIYPITRLKNGQLNGYYVGHYPPASENPLSTPPAGFIEVTPDNINTFLTPHFTLGQFLSKQESGYPKYAIVTEKLLLKLEAILGLANTKGYPCRTFTIMSGYRTPYLNKAIGNETSFSRHLWGLAADIYIDEAPKDGLMDDINHDGRIDKKDTEILYSLINAFDYDTPFLKGGLANYKATTSHGPFVHVDARGFIARWNG